MPKLVYADGSGARGSVEVGNEPVLIGRATDCQIQTQDGLVSRRHARVVFDGAYWVEDLGSANGVFVGNERVQRQQLRPGEVFRCGGLEVRFEADPWAAAPPAQGSSQLHQMLTQPPSPVPVIPSAPPPLPVSPPPPPPVPVPAAVPPPAPVPSASVTPGASAAELQALRSELESERRRRTDVEFERDEAKRKLEELSARPAGLGAEEAERLKRRVEQLESEVRRKGSGGGGDARSFDAERERLRARIAELEAQVAATPAAPAAAPAKNEDQEMEVIRLRRKVEQLESDLRRARGGKAPPPEPAAAAPSTSSAPSEAMTKLTEELERAKRRVEQLESEAKRRPVGTIADGQRLEAQRVELEGALRQLRDVERERDSLREMVATGGAQAAAKPPAKVAEHLTAVSDGLADVRAALRAAGDDLALEQLEQIRAALRQAATALGLSI